ncbi:MAG: cobyric acid synthase, partial [Bacteroidetes bacterium]
SDVGKSVLVAGLGRLLARKGIRVLPFKAQNMANNAAVCADGSEIGRAQALQALACGFEPVAQMNPLLLKPNSETGSQVVALGRPVGNMDVHAYHAWRDTGWAIVEKAYRQLAERAQVMLIEGAGSIAEINLRDRDITNLAVARMADAGVLLVADIERGGVFASILGTLQLLDPGDRARVLGVIINRFRGDASLLEPGIRELEARTGVPVLGVVPWLDLHLPAEDSLSLDNRVRSSEGVVRIGVVRLPRIANSTDFEPFEQEPGVVLQYLTRPEELAGVDLLILPGTKSTLGDLDWLRRTGLAEAIRAWHASGGMVVGICGGFQMLGQRVTDPDGVEGAPSETEGLGLLDIETVMRPVKQTHQVEATFLTAAGAAGFAGFERIRGYEIHAGETRYGILARPLLRLTRRSGEEVAIEDGAVSSDGRVWGSYLHGLFDDERLRHALLLPLFLAKGIEPEGQQSTDLDSELDRLAGHLETHLDLEPVWRHLGLENVS